MAYEGVGYTPGTGATVAADTVGGKLYQAVKLDIGDVGASSPVTASNPFPITVSGGSVSSFGLVFNGIMWDPLKKPRQTTRLTTSAATTNATLVKNSPGDLFKVTGMNTAAAPRYLKLYNKASAPTVGTDVPIWVEYLPAQAKIPAIDFGGMPLYFSIGIAFAITGAAADSDTTAIAAGDIMALNLAYA